MLFKSFPKKSDVLRIVGVMTVVAAALVSVSAQPAQRAAPVKVLLPDEAVGVGGIAGALISVYDKFDVVALGEMHDWRPDSDIRIALVRHPDFAKKVRTIVVEWGSTKEQATLDRYIRGENVSKAQFEQVWKTLSPGNLGDLVKENSIYTDFFAAVRDVNSKLPATERIRVFGGDPGPAGSRDTAAANIVKEQALQKHGKALIIYGTAHFYRGKPNSDFNGIVNMLERDYPGRTFAVIPVGGRFSGGNVADYQMFDSALKTKVRPVMVPAQRLPFRDYTAEAFLGDQVVRCRPGAGCESIFKGSKLTLGNMGDAFIYFGRS